YIHIVINYFFFFQAEDGIRDRTVTGVQTCALPIYASSFARWALVSWFSTAARRAANFNRNGRRSTSSTISKAECPRPGEGEQARSEERRVGKECRTRWWREH